MHSIEKYLDTLAKIQKAAQEQKVIKDIMKKRKEPTEKNCGKNYSDSGIKYTYIGQLLI